MADKKEMELINKLHEAYSRGCKHVIYGYFGDHICVIEMVPKSCSPKNCPFLKMVGIKLESKKN
ncbi:MAG: hypothetical protein QW279_01220 [Candidatus Jordarchaeaceae archaeon]